MKKVNSLTAENLEFLISFLSDYADDYEKRYPSSSTFDSYCQGVAKGYRDVITFIRFLTMPL